MLWSTTAVTDTISGLCAGGYSVTVTDGNGCDSTVSVVITDPDTLQLNTLAAAEICLGDCNGGIVLSASGGTAPFLFSFDGGQSFDTVQVVGDLCGDEYVVLVSDANGCAAGATVTVPAGPPYADATILPAGPFCVADAPVQLQAAEGGGTWSGPGITDAVAGSFDPALAGAGEVVVTYIIPGMCGGQENVSLLVEDCEPFLTVSNVFTPNGDLVNDIFTVQGNGLVRVHGQVYNRYGQLIHEWQGIRGGWDGRTYAGEPCSEGTYFYVVKAQAEDGRQFEQHGSFTLLR